MCFLFWMVGCFTTPPTTTPTETDTSVPEPTGTTADTSLDTVALLYLAWEDDRQCWAVREVERPAELWGTYVDQWCSGREYGGQTLRAIAEGHCAQFSGRFEGECAVEDPEWLLPCSEIAGCCDHDWRNELGCEPDPYYPTPRSDRRSTPSSTRVERPNVEGSDP